MPETSPIWWPTRLHSLLLYSWGSRGATTIRGQPLFKGGNNYCNCHKCILVHLNSSKQHNNDNSPQWFAASLRGISKSWNIVVKPTNDATPCMSSIADSQWHKHCHTAHSLWQNHRHTAHSQWHTYRHTAHSQWHTHRHTAHSLTWSHCKTRLLRRKVSS